MKDALKSRAQYTALASRVKQSGCPDFGVIHMAELNLPNRKRESVFANLIHVGCMG